MCLDCGCGELHNNHGNPLHLTIGRFKLIASLNDRSMYQTALIIVATLIGLIKKDNPLGTDTLKGDPKRIEVKPELVPKYVKMGVPTKKEMGALAKPQETRMRREHREERSRTT
jgi:hypothetical protein